MDAEDPAVAFDFDTVFAFDPAFVADFTLDSAPVEVLDP